MVIAAAEPGSGTSRARRTLREIPGIPVQLEHDEALFLNREFEQRTLYRVHDLGPPASRNCANSFSVPFIREVHEKYRKRILSRVLTGTVSGLGRCISQRLCFLCPDQTLSELSLYSA